MVEIFNDAMQIKVIIFWRNDFQAGPLGCNRLREDN